MRIIAGNARGLHIDAPKGKATRPTSDRVREALFSILESQLGTLANTNVLDLFAGSGALGLEAISRGAAHAVLVDYAAQCYETILANSRKTNAEAQCLILKMDVYQSLKWLTQKGKLFQIVFADPPYIINPNNFLNEFSSYHLLSPGGRLVLEHSNHHQDPQENWDDLHLEVRKRYGDTRLSIFST